MLSLERKIVYGLLGMSYPARLRIASDFGLQDVADLGDNELVRRLLLRAREDGLLSRLADDITRIGGE